MADEKLLREIGARINQARKSKGITQEQLAESMDVSIQMISNLELGKKAVRPENIVKLCIALDISADYILRGITPLTSDSPLFKKINALSHEKQSAVEKLIDLM